MVQEGEDRGERQLNRRTFLKGVAATAGIAGALGSRSMGASASSGDGGSSTETTAEDDETNTDGADGDPWGAPTLGANLNGRPRRLGSNLELLDESNTTWVRAFFDVRKKMNDGLVPSEDPDVVALRRAVREQDCKLIVSLKWGFKVNWQWDEKESMPVPDQGSRYEAEMLRCATRYLGAIDEPIDVVVLGNEPMWETEYTDIVTDDPPIVRFTRTVKEHLLAHGDHGTPKYLLGAFNQMDNRHLWKYPYSAFGREMFQMAREDDDIDGIDLHVHYDELADARKMLETARELVPDGMLTVTEFSPVVRYEKHAQTPIGGWETGREFAAEYGYPQKMSVVDYFELAKEEPRSRDELGDFYAAMPWYGEDELERTYELFDQYDVSIGTLGFMQDKGMRKANWRRPDWSPFHINLLYQQALMEGDGAHPHYFEDYRRFAG